MVCILCERPWLLHVGYVFSWTFIFTCCDIPCYPVLLPTCTILVNIFSADIYDERDLHLPNLTLFDASQNNLTRFDCGFLKHMPNLKHLDLSKVMCSSLTNIIAVYEYPICLRKKCLFLLYLLKHFTKKPRTVEFAYSRLFLNFLWPCTPSINEHIPTKISQDKKAEENNKYFYQ